MSACIHCKSEQNKMHNEYLCMDCYLDYLVYESDKVMALYNPSKKTLLGYQIGFDGDERAKNVLIQLENQQKYLNKYVKCKCSTEVPIEKAILVGYQREIHAFCDSDCYFEWRENITNKGVE